MYRYLAIFIFALLCILTISRSASGADETDCVTKTEFVEVRGTSLAPLVEPGQTIKLLYGYYDCHPVKREDIIAYHYAGNPVPIIKIVKALPGDRWQLRKKKDYYLIVVNGRPIVNSEGKLYKIPEGAIKMLKLYAQDYPTLPEGVYLILGNNPLGTLDSTHFGLIGKVDILAKAELM